MKLYSLHPNRSSSEELTKIHNNIWQQTKNAFMPKVVWNENLRSEHQYIADIYL